MPPKIRLARRKHTPLTSYPAPSLRTPPAQALQQLPAVFRAVLALLNDLPAAPLLSENEQRRRSGPLFRGAQDFCLRTADLLRAHPERYPDLPGAGSAVDDHQRLADRYALLRDLLNHLATRCNHGYLYHQSEALQETHRALQCVEASLQHPGINPTLDHDARAEDIRCPLLVLDEERARQTARRLAAQRRNRSQSAPAQEPTPAQRKRAGRTAEDRREDVAALLHDLVKRGPR